MSTPNILLIGASGRLGLELLRAASQSPSKPAMHAFVRTPSKLPGPDKERCSSIFEGDARRTEDVRRALEETQADVVVLSIGVPNSAARTDVREASAKALVENIRPGAPFEHVKVVVVSSVGAGGSRLEFGMGLGRLTAFIIRHVLRDHDRRERLFQVEFQGDEKKRVLIVRPTTLTLGKPRGEVVLFEGGRVPSMWIDRADLAVWIIREICSGGSSFGRAVNITGK